MTHSTEFLHLAFIQGIGAQELLLIFLVLLLLFGAKKLPELARGLGKSMTEFKKASREVESEFRSAIEEEEKKPSAPQATAPQPPDTIKEEPAEKHG